MKQTAVEWLLDRIEDVDNTPEIWEQIKVQAKEMEKQQIIDSYAEGMGHYGDANRRSDAEQHYKETFKNK